MNRLHTFLQRLHAPKAQAAAAHELRVLSPADLKLVAGGLPRIGGLSIMTPPTEAKPVS